MNYKIILSFVLFLILGCTFKAQTNFDLEWKKIEAMAKAGQYKSTLPLIQKLQQKALVEKNHFQLVKSLRYEYQIGNYTKDDSENRFATDFYLKLDTLNNQMSPQIKPLIRVLQIEYLMDYYQNNRWRISGRTSTEQTGDLETWSKLQFKNQISNLFAQINSASVSLDQMKLGPLAEVLENSEYLKFHPTLLEWKNLKEVEFLSQSAFFTPLELKKNKETILNLFDTMIAKHSGNTKLYYLHKKLLFECPHQQCEDLEGKLLNLISWDPQQDYQIMLIQDLAQSYSENNKKQQALDLIKKAQQTYTTSPFLRNLKNIENQILQEVLVLKFQGHNLPNEPIHTVAEYKNARAFSIRIYTVQDINAFMAYLPSRWDNESFKKIAKNRIHTLNYSLPPTPDFQMHKTSIELPGLKSGVYVGEYLVKDTVVEKFYFTVGSSGLVYEDIPTRDGALKYRLVDRRMGAPLVNTELSIKEYLRGKPGEQTNVVTDANGVFIMPEPVDTNYYRQFLLHVPREGGYVLFNRYGRDTYENYTPKVIHHVQIFTDRAIYRPGQTLYFKVIATTTDPTKANHKVIPGKALRIVLKDANGQEIQRQNIITNIHGSESGNFIIPAGRLNGSFCLEIENAEKSVDGDFFSAYKCVQVEEYKRPTFEITLDPVKGDYSYGQEIMVSGTAKTYSGVAMSNQKITYEIKKRNIRYLYFPWYPRNNDSENVIIGEVQTDGEGRFQIPVTLREDNELDGIQIDNYQITVSISDLGGEFQSKSQDFKVSSITHYIEAKTQPTYFNDENVTIPVALKNYSGELLKKSYSVRLEKLKGRDRLYRKTFLNEAQDQPLKSREEFISVFPFDPYHKNDLKNEKKAETIVMGPIVKASDSLSLGSLTEGSYRLIIYNIEESDTIKIEREFEVFSKNGLAPNQKPLLRVMAPETVDAGKDVDIYIYSALNGVRVHTVLQSSTGERHRKELKIINGVGKLTVPSSLTAKEGTLDLQVQLLALNSYENYQNTVRIVSHEKPLVLETLVFRDKLEPGKKEKWALKLKEATQDISKYEFLVSMYDRALDQFATNSWQWSLPGFATPAIARYHMDENLEQRYYSKRYEYVNPYEITGPGFSWTGRLGLESLNYAAPPPVATQMVIRGQAAREKDSKAQIEESVVADSTQVSPSNTTPTLRENLSETAFFYPHLTATKDGVVHLEFTAPEALTQWRMQALAHGTSGEYALLDKTVVTQKEISVSPNYPRFLREGDTIEFTARISRLNSEVSKGSVALTVTDALTGENLSQHLTTEKSIKSFDFQGQAQTAVRWKLNVPQGISAMIFKVVATAGKFSDGEQKSLPILPNTILVTDSKAIHAREGKEVDVQLPSLTNLPLGARTYSAVLEIITNPLWDIMLALPSLKSETQLSSDNLFNKWFADVIGVEMVKRNPQFKQFYEQKLLEGGLESNLNKNSELKQVLMDETPWVLESKDEDFQMQQIARYFDSNTIRMDLRTNWSTFAERQNPDGGFSWYPGYPSSFGVSLYILKQLGRLSQWMDGSLIDYAPENSTLEKNLVDFVDRYLQNHFGDTTLDKPNNYVLEYLDARSRWENKYPLKGRGLEWKKILLAQADSLKLTDFTFYGLHRTALLLQIYGKKEVALKLATYLKETSVESEEVGTYWKNNAPGWGYYNAQIDNHAGAMEAINTITPEDANFIEGLKVHLATHKRSNSWPTSRSSAEVIYLMLSTGVSWLASNAQSAEVVWGSRQLTQQELESGYFKEIVQDTEQLRNAGWVSVKKSGPGVVLGGIHHLYYQNADQVLSSSSGLSVEKQYYTKVSTSSGSRLDPISDNSVLQRGDKVTVRLVLNADRDFEYLHLKDLRPAGMEPVDVISGFSYKDGFGYYQSTKDASSNFFIQYLPKGRYVLEYDLTAFAAGDFSTGPATIQSFYSPEMNARSHGQRVSIDTP